MEWTLAERFRFEGGGIAPGRDRRRATGVVMHGTPFSSLEWRRIDPWLGDEGQRAFWRQVAQMDGRYTEEADQRYAEIRCPVTILWSADDEWIPLKDGEELARRIAGAPFTVVPDAKHLVQEDAPEAIVATVPAFWNAVEGAR